MHALGVCIPPSNLWAPGYLPAVSVLWSTSSSTPLNPEIMKAPVYSSHVVKAMVHGLDNSSKQTASSCSKSPHLENLRLSLVPKSFKGFSIFQPSLVYRRLPLALCQCGSGCAMSRVFCSVFTFEWFLYSHSITMACNSQGAHHTLMRDHLLSKFIPAHVFQLASLEV